MNKTVHFVLQDIKRNIVSYILILVQIIIAAIVLCYALSLINEGIVQIHKMKELDNANTIYKISTDLEVDEIDALADNKKKTKDIILFKKYLESSRGVTSVTAENSMQFELNSNDANRLKKELEGGIRTTAAVEMVMVSDNFFEFFNIAGNYDLTEEGDKGKGVILGYSFKNYYDSGDIITDAYGDKYIVKGFLPKGAFYVNPFETKTPLYLDDFFVTAAKVSEKDSIGVFTNMNSSFVTVRELANNIPLFLNIFITFCNLCHIPVPLLKSVRFAVPSILNTGTKFLHLLNKFMYSSSINVPFVKMGNAMLGNSPASSIRSLRKRGSPPAIKIKDTPISEACVKILFH